MRKKEVDRIYRAINRKFSGPRMELCEYMESLMPDILDEAIINPDDYEKATDACIDSAGKEYFNYFAPSIMNHCNDKNSRIKVERIEGTYYIDLSEYGKNADNQVIEYNHKILQTLCESDLSNKGILYEKFCCILLKEVGEFEITPSSNDKGIDIVGTISNPLFAERMAMIDKAKVIIQVKLYDKRIDSPVARRFLADALFETFDSGSGISLYRPTQTCIIAHSGFSRETKILANRFGLKLYDSMDLLRGLAGIKDLGSSECIRYLNRLKAELKMEG